MAGRDAGPGGDGQGGPPGVPPSVLRSWDQAEARLFPLVMAQPELYQQALGLVQRLLGGLRETCPDLPALLAADGRAGDLVTDLGCEPVPGVNPDLIAAAACATRYRELAALIAAAGRLTALARAREQGAAWTVAEETGHAERVPYAPYSRIEAEVATGRAVIVSAGPDETLSRAVYHLDTGQIDLATGVLTVGEPYGSYLDPGELEAALGNARGQAQADPGATAD